MNHYAFGLLAGSVLLVAFVGGFLTAVHIRFWKEKLEALADDHDVRERKAINRESVIERMFEKDEIEERATGDFSPMGDVPPTPAAVKRERAKDRLRRRAIP